MRPADVKDRPIWLKRSVAPPLLAYPDRPVRATNATGGTQSPSLSSASIFRQCERDFQIAAVDFGAPRGDLESHPRLLPATEARADRHHHQQIA